MPNLVQGLTAGWQVQGREPHLERVPVRVLEGHDIALERGECEINFTAEMCEWHRIILSKLLEQFSPYSSTAPSFALETSLA